MSKKSAPRLTSQMDFERCNANGDLLFSVRAGVNAVDALETASCYMASARHLAQSLANELSEDGGNDRVWAAYYLITMAKAVLDAAVGRVADEDRGDE